MGTNATDIKTPAYAHLQELSLDAAQLYGGKAAALGALLQAGVQIPEGVALSSHLYDGFLEQNQFPYEHRHYVSQNDTIAEFIRQGSFPQSICDMLLKVYQSLTEHDRHATVAVRSSALCEDHSAHSLAGIFESYTNLTTYDAMIQAIKACYASLFSDRAIAMLLRQRIALSEMRMGVILQRFMPGAPSGVMFSADTVAMDPDMLVINTVNGGCAEYVNGTLLSALYHVRKSTGDLVSSHDVSPDTCLSDEALATLRKAALHIEQTVGPYQDIEWTFNHGRLCILQARPITTFTESDHELVWPVMPDEERTWLRDDKVPQPLKPLQQVIATQIIQCVHHGMMLTGKGSGFESMPVHGHLYIHFPRRLSKRRDAYNAKLDTFEATGNNIYLDDLQPQILAYKKILDGYLHRSLNGEELADFVETAIEYCSRSQEFHFMAMDADRYLPTFEAYCREICPDVTSHDLYDLLYQESWLTKDRATILRMVKWITAHPSLVDLFATQPYDELLFARLDRLSEGRDLVAQIMEYLKDFGLFKHTDVDYPPSVLLENPSSVIGRIRGCLTCDADALSLAQETSYARKPIVLQYILDRLPESEHRVFLHKLRTAEKAFLAGEDHHYHIELTFLGYPRIATIEAGKYLVDKDRLVKPDDVLFLWPDELKRLLTTDAEDIKDTIRERQVLYRRQKTLVPPNTLGKVPKPRRQDSVGGTVETPQRLTGVSGCRKSVKGRVIVHTELFQPFDMAEPGIVVFPHGHGQYLLPLLGQIQGLIFDYGSPYDHLGILARELDIPVIYKTKTATKVLQTGDTVEINGVHGEVILSR